MIVERDDKAEFEMSLDDTRSNTLARAFTDQVALVSELPNRASNGYLVNVSADPSTVLDDRWLAFQTFDNSDIGEVDGVKRLRRTSRFKSTRTRCPMSFGVRAWMTFTSAC